MDTEAHQRLREFRLQSAVPVALWKAARLPGCGRIAKNPGVLLNYRDIEAAFQFITTTQSPRNAPGVSWLPSMGQLIE